MPENGIDVTAERSGLYESRFRMSPEPEAATPPSAPFTLPWMTAAAALLALAFWYWPGAFDLFVYDRAQILHGQVWRALTGHWVHYSGTHLFWNLVVLLIAGTWLERHNRAAALWTFVTAPAAISIGLLAFEPSLRLYAGISGVVSGLLVGLVTWGLRADPGKRWLWLSVTALFAAKIALELVAPHSLPSTLTPLPIQTVPLAHLIGASTGALIVLGTLRPAGGPAEPH